MVGTEGRVGSFGEQLRRYREAMGLSQEELAERAGLTANAIGALERGERRRPYPDTLRRLADALGLGETQRAELAASLSPTRGSAAADPAAEPSGTALAPQQLPREPTPLIGREREAEVVLHLLSRPEVRLLTLTGPGGVGKTRLALHVAGEVGNRFPDGVAWAPLAPLDDPELVLPTIVRSLGLREAPGQDPREVLRSHLCSRRALLVLDNFEHVLDAAADVAELLLSCPDVDMLATSRAPLGVRGEQEYPVPPLELPAPPRVRAPRDVEAAAAVRLFVRRAQEASPTFALTEENAAAVAAICRRLDGLPLALELAAARVKLLSPAELLARLDRALPLLTGGARDLPARQRTIESAIRWSYDLLGPSEQALFRRLAIFTGGWTLEAAEAVGSGGSVRAEEVLDLLGRLVGQSLAVAEVREDGATRYRMLEPVRQYARRLLEEGGELEQVAGQHAEYHLQLAERAEREWAGPHQAEWLERLEAEHDNLRAAISWALADGQGDPAGTTTGLRLVTALWWFWEVRCELAEGRMWLERAVAGAADAPAHLRAEVCYALGAFAIRQGDYAAADVAVGEGLALARGLEDDRVVARSLTLLGEVALRRGEHARARALIGESLALMRALGDRVEIARSLNLAGLVARDAGDYGQAQADFEESLALMRELGRQWSVAIAAGNLGNLALRQGDAARATALLGEGLRLARSLGAKWTIAHCLEGFAGVAAGRGEAERAARLWGAAEALREAVGAPLPPNLASHHAGLVAAARAGADEAAWAVAWAAGRALPPEEAVAEALEESA